MPGAPPHDGDPQDQHSLRKTLPKILESMGEIYMIRGVSWELISYFHGIS